MIAPRIPDEHSEARLTEIRRQAQEKGAVQARGVRVPGAPFPRATAQDGYYGIPLLKQPQWKWEVPVYFFVGGAAGASAVIAAMANWTGADRRLARDARWLAVGGGALSAALLTADLGVPRRFLNMLRVFKLQSPMSVGAWMMTAFTSASAAAVFASFIRERVSDSLPVQLIENAGEIVSALTGLGMSSYTGVLIGATAIPVWNENIDTLPIHFAASGLGAAVSILELAGHDAAALNLLGIGSAIAEALEGLKLESQNHEVNRPLRRGASGWVTRAGGVLSGPAPLVLRLLAAVSSNQRARDLRKQAALMTVAGSLLTRIGWLRAGHASSRDYRLPLEIPTTSRSIPAEIAQESSLTV
jgi:hypothetical protein